MLSVGKRKKKGSISINQKLNTDILLSDIG